ncbi:hypothetical protein SV7mr_07140 [Stieleria bergensis]|uniref:Uncharacterized protein n=1 Tax=Stieleria bergensis TaxID=2528025 RepID=A0A517SQ24_9BACT|nr:hypothetical protein SV7mr_07140 [Planctomycetes bacterium SV_7m_r]
MHLKTSAIAMFQVPLIHCTKNPPQRFIFLTRMPFFTFHGAPPGSGGCHQPSIALPSPLSYGVTITMGKRFPATYRPLRIAPISPARLLTCPFAHLSPQNSHRPDRVRAAVAPGRRLQPLPRSIQCDADSTTDRRPAPLLWQSLRWHFLPAWSSQPTL